MYLQSLKLTLRLYPYVLLVIVFHLVFGVFSDVILSKGNLSQYQILVDIGNLGEGLGTPVSFILKELLAFFACVLILKISFLDYQSKVRRFAVFAIVALALNILADLPWNIFRMFEYFTPVDPQAIPADNWVVSIITYVGLFNYLFGALVYSLLGTMLVAVAATGMLRPAAAYQRGKSTFWFVFMRLAIGPGMLIILASLIQSGFYLGIVDQYGLAFTSILGRLVQLIDQTIQYFITSWILVMSVWIFSKAYIITTTQPDETA